MLLCATAQIMIAIVIMIEMDREIVWNVRWDVTLVRFISLSLIHFGLANEYNVAMKCMKYLAFHQEQFKYKYRAFFAAQLAILAVLFTEALSIYYIMVFGDTLGVINNFIKMKIIAQFDDFFAESFKQSPMAAFMG